MVSFPGAGFGGSTGFETIVSIGLDGFRGEKSTKGFDRFGFCHFLKPFRKHLNSLRPIKFGQKVEALTAFIEFYMEDSLPLSRFARKSYVFVAISVHFDDAVDC